MMKKREKLLSKKVLALGLTGALLGSVGYVLPVAAAELIITTDQSGDVVPAGTTGNNVTIGTPGDGTSPSIGTSGNRDVYGGSNERGSAGQNTVIVHSGTMTNVFGSRCGDEGSTSSVTINGGTIENVYGANSRSGAITDNSVTVNGGTVGVAYGGFSYTGDITGNKVTISGGEVSRVYGGYSSSDITGNEVTISGGMVESDVYGGYSDSSSYTGNIKDNSITISSEGDSKPTFCANTVLYGGFVKGGGSLDKISGNELNIKTSGLTVKNVANFDAYNFYLQSNTTKDDVLLTLTDTNGTDISNSSVNVGMAGSASVLQVGDSVTLMKNGSSNGITADGVTYGKLTQGVSLDYKFTTALSEDGKELVTTISEAPTVSTETKSPVETQVAAAAFLSSGADLLAGQGMASAVAVAGAGQADIFGAMGGGNMRYKSGSYADVHGWNLALGVGKAVANNSGKLTFGPFVEYGRGNYTSHLDSGVRGDGTTKYYGVGVLARQDNKSGVYYEGSLRYGRLDSDYASNDMGADGVRSSYETSSAYYGAHLALGKITKLNDKVYADIYTKLMYNHQGSDSVALGGEGNGEVYSFDSVNSTRVRAGIRLSKDYNTHNTAYAGVAYEHEFDSEARATVQGLSTPAPSIKGSSGMLELGYILQPKGANDMSIDIGLQGWAGKKQGVSGSVNFVWTF